MNLYSEAVTLGTRMRKLVLFLLTALLFSIPSAAQTDWIRTGTGLGVEKVRIAVPDFKTTSADPANAALLKTFNETLFNDLTYAGIFDVVSKSFYPLQVPGSPQEIQLEPWGNPPPNAAMVAFGNFGKNGDDDLRQLCDRRKRLPTLRLMAGMVRNNLSGSGSHLGRHRGPGSSCLCP